MNCIIVDDDEFTRLDLENKVRHVSFLELTHSCSNAMEAASIILKEQVDLVILDVMLPEMNGLQFMQALSNERPQVVLVSSNKDYALDAFEHDVTDFLVKPVSMERFFKAMAKVKSRYDAGSGISSHDAQHIFIKVNSRMVRIILKNVLYVEALADYVTVHTTETKFTVLSTMKAMEQALGEKDFYRVHNSYIVRLDRIASLEDNCLVIADKLIPISRSKMKGLMQRLKFLG